MTSVKQGHQASQGHSRYQMLDIWRGVVCLVVVLEHAGVALWTSQYNDVQGFDGFARRALHSALTWNFGSLLFFVMSGYCIAASLDGSRRRGDAPGFFLYRRFWRIYPTYWAALAAFLVFVIATDFLGNPRLHENGVSLALSSPSSLDFGQWLGNFTLTETWRPRIGGNSEVAVFTRVAWSLCYQEQFYFVCMLALWLFPARLDKALACLTGVLVTFRLILEDSGRLHLYEGTFPLYWHVFAIGLAVYWRLNLSSGSPTWARRGVDVGLGAMACLAATTGSVQTTAPYVFGLSLIGMHRFDAIAGNSRWLQPLRACGRRSYSIYLIHLPITIVGNGALIFLGLDSFWARCLVVLPVVTAGSVAAGWAFHTYVESHFMGLPPVLGRLAPAHGSGRVAKAA